MSTIQPYGKTFVWALWLIVIVESLSLLAHTFEFLQLASFIMVVAIVLAVSLWKLHYGLYAALGELFIGSFGYMFYADLGSFRISVRLALFLVVFIAWLVHCLRRKQVVFLKTIFFRPLLLLMGFLLLGAAIGLRAGNDVVDVFFDANGYLYFGMIGVIFSTIVSWNRVSQVVQVLFAAVTTMAIKTFALLFYFAHQTDTRLIREVYTWVRDTRVGEISPVVDNYYRIFFQGHLWSLVALIIAVVMLLLSKQESRRTKMVYWIITGLTSTTLIISFSRSIWLSMVVTFALFAIWVLSKRLINFTAVFKILGVVGVFLVAELLFITFLVNVPLPGGNAGSLSAGSLVKDRVTESNEAAVGSRFELIGPLSRKVLEKPVLGSGFASTVTYTSHDPRTKDVDNGQYTTYSFEWGYLEIAVKMGMLGLLAYGYFIWTVARLGLRAVSQSRQVEIRSFLLAMLFAFYALLIIHFTTPYINHPLGITLIMLCASIFYLGYKEIKVSKALK